MNDKETLLSGDVPVNAFIMQMQKEFSGGADGR
jgi:hypothetical protein